jgi:hypothetical protein
LCLATSWSSHAAKWDACEDLGIVTQFASLDHQDADEDLQRVAG